MMLWELQRYGKVMQDVQRLWAQGFEYTRDKPRPTKVEVSGFRWARNQEDVQFWDSRFKVAMPPRISDHPQNGYPQGVYDGDSESFGLPPLRFQKRCFEKSPDGKCPEQDLELP